MTKEDKIHSAVIALCEAHREAIIDAIAEEREGSVTVQALRDLDEILMGSVNFNTFSKEIADDNDYKESREWDYDNR